MWKLFAGLVEAVTVYVLIATVLLGVYAIGQGHWALLLLVPVGYFTAYGLYSRVMIPARKRALKGVAS